MASSNETSPQRAPSADPLAIDIQPPPTLLQLEVEAIAKSPPSPLTVASPKNRPSSHVIEELSSDSSSSDDVEFVSEMPMIGQDHTRPAPPKRHKPAPLFVQVNRQKYTTMHRSGVGNLSNGKTSGGASPRINDEAPKVTTEKQKELDKDGHDLDVKQIMRDLKHLQVREHILMFVCIVGNMVLVVFSSFVVGIYVLDIALHCIYILCLFSSNYLPYSALFVCIRFF